jgi:hypothetical protein
MKPLLFVGAALVLVTGFVLAGWLIIGATVVASTGTLSGGWGGVETSAGVVLGVAILLAGFLGWLGLRRRSRG